VAGWTRRGFLTATACTTFTATLGSGQGLAKEPAYVALEKVENSARLSGTLKYSGPAVEIEKARVTKDSVICGEGFKSMESFRVREDGALADGVIQLRGIAQGKAWAPIYDEAKIFQVDCAFQPYVQVVNRTSTLRVINLDPILHNIHAYEVIGKVRRSMFNFTQTDVLQEDQVPLKFRRGHLITIDCNAHNWMASWIYASPNPYLSVTSEDGRFAIGDIPAGEYELVAWHPVLGEKTGRLKIGAGDDLEFDLVWSS